MATTKGGQLDQKAKRKLIFASVVLAVAVVWIIYYMTSSGPAAPEEKSPEEIRQLEEQHAQEMEEVKKQQESFRGAKNQLPPSGS